ncbi:H(+)/Cl(-) exchange transporter 3-like [Condylostylus longicornis]|uniref:H(+)/Cl(-) exchange transporter 3-like n=1 Tax=Condylostylus longicornis TaxID=2530218 RepID=UPI00244DFE98|nr:H(+)/Cl(-) exchange transporter 3-like [Condylostylus longicornis]
MREDLGDSPCFKWIRLVAWDLANRRISSLRCYWITWRSAWHIFHQAQCEMDDEEATVFDSLASHPIYEVALVTLGTCFINYPLPMLRTPSSFLLEQLFGRCGVSSDPDVFSLCSLRSDDESSYSDYSLKWTVLLELGFAAVVRFFQTVLTFGIGVPAGLFVPSLMVGALIGRFVGLVMIKLNSVFGFVSCHKCLHPGVYAIVGAAAMLGGVTRVTISIVVIMFELTGGLSYVVPFMVAVMIAKWVGEALCDKSIYDCYIRLKGYPYLDDHLDVSLQGISARQHTAG